MRISDWSSDVCSSDLQAVAVTDGAAWHRSVDGGGMSSAGGRRRSLLANAIESIGTTPVPTPTAAAPVADDTPVRDTPAEATASPSFLDRRWIAFAPLPPPVNRPTFPLHPSES